MKATQEKQVRVLKTNIPLWNRYIRFCLSVNIDFRADLSGSNLRGSDLRDSDLRGSDLSGSDLSYSNLSYSDLRGSNLRDSDLRCSNLKGSDLRGSNLDMSCLPLWCGSLKAKFDLKLRVQIGFHFASLIANGIDVTDEEKQIYNSILEYVNKFHRTDVERLKSFE